MKKLEPKTRGWKLSATMSCLAMWAAVSVAVGKDLTPDRIDGDGDQTLALTVRVFIYAPVPSSEMSAAERVASKIFQKAGLEMTWLDCPMTGTPATLNPACSAFMTLAEIHLNIMPDFPKIPQVEESAMGFALTVPPPDRGQFASISYGQVRRQLLHASQLTLDQLLGRGMAHEIGHLLLGTNSHAPTGLMSAQWSEQKMKLAAFLQFDFSKDQAARIRGDVRARMRQQESQQMAQRAPI